jgi:hypothetical protein
MKPRRSFVTCLSILGIGDVPAFMIKGDAHAFMMREGMGDASTFMIKGDAHLAMRVSLLSEKRARLGY